MRSLISRRGFLAALVQATTHDIRRELFLASPVKGVAVMAYAFYSRPRGGDMISIEQRWTRSDTIDVAYIRRSRDNGRTWIRPSEIRTGERLREGMLRRHSRYGFVDAVTGHYLEFWIEGVLPTDDPLEGLRNWNIYYRVSRDGGRTFGAPHQVIHAGAEFDERHPLPGVSRAGGPAPGLAEGYEHQGHNRSSPSKSRDPKQKARPLYSPCFTFHRNPSRPQPRRFEQPGNDGQRSDRLLGPLREPAEEADAVGGAYASILRAHGF